LSFTEGSGIFLGEGKRWESDAGAVKAVLYGFIEAKYGL